jgi:enterochelin esterase-like enzyme
VEISRDIYEHPEMLKKNLWLLHFVVGDQDVLHEADKRLAALLTQHGVKLTFQAVPGMHEYKVWRQGLHDVAPLLFASVQ